MYWAQRSETAAFVCWCAAERCVGTVLLLNITQKRKLMATLFGSVGVETAELVGTQQLFTPRVGPNRSFYIVLQCLTWHKVQAGTLEIWRVFCIHMCSHLCFCTSVCTIHTWQLVYRKIEQLWLNQTILCIPIPSNVRTFPEPPTHMPLKQSKPGFRGGPQLPVVRQTGLSQVAVKGS